MESSSTIYQFKVTLRGITPPIWRRIEVPDDFTFGKLHYAIQSAMGWCNCYTHTFTATNPQGENVTIGRIDHRPVSSPITQEEMATISQYFPTPKSTVVYQYDLFVNTIVLEKIFKASPNEVYPKCTGGKRASPLEDTAGIEEYKRFLNILKDPEHPEYLEYRRWLYLAGHHGEFDPEAFNPDDVTFHAY